MNPKIVLVLFLPAFAAGADLNPLINAARTAPPEFAADALIRIAGVEALPPARRMELLGEAFEAARHAQLPLKRHAALARQDGPIRFLNRAYDQNLDALSLQTRAVEAALSLDPVQARAWLSKIAPPDVPKLACDDFLAYDVSRLYDLVGRAAQSFSQAERAKGEAFRLIRRYVAAVTSPVEAAPAARLVAHAPVGDEDFVALISIFGAALGKIAGDDRSFTYSRTVGNEIDTLAAECKRRNIASVPLIESYRFYLVTNLSGPRCADDEQLAGNAGMVGFGLASGVTLDPLSSDYIRFFNEKLRTGQLARIGEEDATPARLEGTVTGLHTCVDEACQAISKLTHDLVMTPEGVPMQPAQRSTAQWRKQFDATLEALGKWKESAHETPIDQFREKADVFSLLVNLAPGADARPEVVRAEIDFLAGNPVEKTNREEWLLPLNILLGRMALEPAGFGKVADELRDSKDPAIALYARLEQAAPRRPDQILPLL